MNDTEAPKTYGWRTWYTIVIFGLTAVVMLPERPFELLYAAPINWLIYYLPVWGVVSIVRYLRKSPTVAPPPS